MTFWWAFRRWLALDWNYKKDVVFIAWFAEKNIYFATSLGCTSTSFYSIFILSSPSLTIDPMTTFQKYYSSSYRVNIAWFHHFTSHVFFTFPSLGWHRPEGENVKIGRSTSLWKYRLLWILEFAYRWISRQIPLPQAQPTHCHVTIRLMNYPWGATLASGDPAPARGTPRA